MFSNEEVGEKMLFILVIAFDLGSFFCVPPFAGVFCFGSFCGVSFDSVDKPMSLVMLLVFLGVLEISFGPNYF